MTLCQKRWCEYSWQLTGLCVVSWFLIFGSGCSSTSGSLATNASIGVVNFQRILQETNAGKEVTDSLNSFMKDRQALVELEQRELRRLENELVAQGSVLSQSARKQREEQFRRRMGEYQQKVADLNREVQEKQKDLLDRFRRTVEVIVSEIAATKRLIMVVEFGEGTTTLYHQPSLDITDVVIVELDKE